MNNDSAPSSDVFSHTTKQFSNTSRCSTIQLKSETIYLDRSSDPIG